MPPAPDHPPALKESLNAARFRRTAAELTALHPAFDAARFLALTLPGLDDLTLIERIRRMTGGLHATLPAGFPRALRILRAWAARLDGGFITLVPPDYVGCHGHAHFDASLDALAEFTRLGTSEFAIREFLRRDLPRTLAVMERWSHDPDEHLRRLASEGCRPRLPWSFRLEPLIADPSPVAPILENLRADPSLYVRKSVANHLNDITKDHPDWVLDRVAAWPADNARTAWVTRHALRTLIKRGHPRALALIGAGEPARVRIEAFTAAPEHLRLGDRLTLTARIAAASPRAQRLVVDYRIHYVKKSGAISGKVFKLREFTLEPGQTLTLRREQTIRDFTTRRHHPGLHAVELLVNGAALARTAFTLGPGRA